MRIMFFSAKSYDRENFERAPGADRHDMVFTRTRLDVTTASLARRFDTVCIFVNDEADGAVLKELAGLGVGLVLLRCAGFNNVDLAAAERLGTVVARVPAYSPHAVAEHAVALMLSLNRGIHRAYNRVREGNFSLAGLLGFDMHGRTVGVVGTGRIGACTARLLAAFGCRVLLSDPNPDRSLEAAGMAYVPLDTILGESDIVTLHAPLTPDTRHMIDDAALARMRPGAMLINTSRGALLDTRAVIAALKSEQLGALGLDVYEEEADLFFEDLSAKVIRDDVFARLLTFPNVLITGHQGFFTRDALDAIAAATLSNADAFDRGEPVPHPVTTRMLG